MKASSILTAARSAHEKLIAGADLAKSPLLLAVRLYWGWQFFTAGKGKLMDLPATASFFKELGIPLPMFNAVVASCTECFGGLLLLMGLASRLTAIPLLVTMIVAYLTADMEVVKGIFSDPDAFVTAAPFLFLLSSLLVLVFGPGVVSIDHLLARKFRASPSATLVEA
ncbi:DoxX family protein [Luteolibacter arcticus]|uniref:DoxX family protein n=1 Tax=Luteolibacter arcticus TaxID=1581411 RepID=A0ABT3GM15_9BACT|nr:DoxX family protein [Luteolibacter arcticus]MCW1924521.1 DoxX family protein [Luteolibacter arcticus]